MLKLTEENTAGRFQLTEKQEILIRNKVSALPRLERLAIYFYFWEQYSHLRIARNLCVPVDEVSELIRSAVSRLRIEFAEIADNYFGAPASSKLEHAA